jgi:hypothetical protein
MSEPYPLPDGTRPLLEVFTARSGTNKGKSGWRVREDGPGSYIEVTEAATHASEPAALADFDHDLAQMMAARGVHPATEPEPPPEEHPFPITPDAKQVVGTRSVLVKPNWGTQTPTLWIPFRGEKNDYPNQTAPRWNGPVQEPDAGYWSLDNLTTLSTVGFSVNGIDYSVPFILTIDEDPLPPPPPPPPPPTGYLNGLFWNRHPRNGEQFIEAQYILNKGKPFDIALEHVPLGSFEEMANVDWFLYQYANLPLDRRPKNVAITVCGLPWGSGTLQAGARGDSDWVFVRQANACKSYGYSAPIIRPLHEPCCYRWGDRLRSGEDSPQDYGRYFDRIYNIFKSILPDSTVVFNPVIGGPDGVPSDVLLSNVAKVDGVGLDVYYTELIDTDAKFQRYVDMPFGFNWMKEQGRRLGVQTGLYEWGVVGRSNPGAITRTRNWCRANGVTCDIFYLDVPPAFDSDIIQHNWTDSIEAYKATVL